MTLHKSKSGGIPIDHRNLKLKRYTPEWMSDS